LTVSEPLRSEHKKIADAENMEFIGKYAAKLRKTRGYICRSLKSSGFQPDPKSYASLNKDLAAALKTDEEFINHFWNYGCYEARPIGKVGIIYYGN